MQSTLFSMQGGIFESYTNTVDAVLSNVDWVLGIVFMLKCSVYLQGMMSNGMLEDVYEYCVSFYTLSIEWIDGRYTDPVK